MLPHLLPHMLPHQDQPHGRPQHASTVAAPHGLLYVKRKDWATLLTPDEIELAKHERAQNKKRREKEKKQDLKVMQSNLDKCQNKLKQLESLSQTRPASSSNAVSDSQGTRSGKVMHPAIMRIGFGCGCVFLQTRFAPEPVPAQSMSSSFWWTKREVDGFPGSRCEFGKVRSFKEVVFKPQGSGQLARVGIETW